MAKPVSEQLSTLSARAKEAEKGVAAAKSKAATKVQQRENEIMAAANRRKEDMRKSGATMHENVDSAWSGVTGKLQSDIDKLRTKIDVKKEQLDQDRAIDAADAAEESAVRAIDFALDAIDYAETSVLDAVLARDRAASF